MTEIFNEICINNQEIISNNGKLFKLKNDNQITKFCLIRHGSTDFNIENRLQGWIDIPLNDEGKRQAQELAFSIKNQHWDVVVSSDLIRAKQTAEIISEILNIPVFLYKGLRERNFGIYEGKLIQEIREMELASNNGNVESEEKDKVNIS